MLLNYINRVDKHGYLSCLASKGKFEEPQSVPHRIFLVSDDFTGRSAIYFKYNTRFREVE